MPIILRLNKGSELTFAELDGNFDNLDGRLDTLENLNVGNRLNSLENNIQLDALDSEEIFRLIDSNYLQATIPTATFDSAGIASFDSNYFTIVDSGHVSIKFSTYDSLGISSFDSQDFIVTSGHVTINPNSPGGRVAGITPIDSTGVASFTDADFNVTTNGHVSLTDSAVRTRISAVDGGGDGSFVYDQATGAFTYTGPSPDSVRSHFSAGTGISITNGVISTTGGSGIPISTFGSIGSIAFVQSYNIPNMTKYGVGASIPGNKLAYGSNTSAVAGHMAPQMVEVGSYGDFLGSSGAILSTTLSGTWRNIGPGWVGYNSGIGGQPAQANGGGHFILVQRIA